MADFSVLGCHTFEYGEARGGALLSILDQARVVACPGICVV